MQSKGTAVIHRADLQPLDNLELFGMSPLYTLESYRAMGRNAAGYALGRRVGPVPDRARQLCPRQGDRAHDAVARARDARRRAGSRAGRARARSTAPRRTAWRGAIGSRRMRRPLLSAALLVGRHGAARRVRRQRQQLQHDSAADWASGYCGDATTWVTSLDEARASVKTGRRRPMRPRSPSPTRRTRSSSRSTASARRTLPTAARRRRRRSRLATTLSGRVARISAAIDTNNPDVTVAQQTVIVQQQIDGEPHRYQDDHRQARARTTPSWERR